jgi:outer membrane protein OmpA-like peptidoglycan-associated protein
MKKLLQTLTFSAVFLVSGLLTGSAFSQPPPNPTRQTIATPQGDTPMFRVTIVGRTIPAIDNRPRSGDTRVDFAGTALMARAKGRASIQGQKGYIRVDARFEDLGAPMQFGREYLTYVLWAITPEGRATNLGELQVNGSKGQLDVTTELQSFALMVTAEPYFAVSQPSDAVVLENVIRDGTKGRLETVEAKYELLKRGSYLMNKDPSVLRVKPLDPGAPLDLAQGRNAVELSRLAGADRYAADTFAKATRLLNEAETAREKRKKGNEVQQPARQAAQTAEDARLIALQRQEEEFQGEQRRLAQQRENDALARARTEEDRRRQADDRRLQAEEQRLQAERQQAQAETARIAAERNSAAADAARLSAERDRTAADAARAAAERDKAAADAARLAAEGDRASAERARQEAERVKAEADAARAAAEAQARQAGEQSEREKAELRGKLRQQLNVILETRETARGLIVNLSDVLFDVDKATLRPGAREKLARVTGILSAHPDLKIEIEGHTDSTGSEDYNQRLSERRAESVRGYMREQGIGQAVVATVGYGKRRPVATNETPVGRQQNRRVELVVTGGSIGHTSQQ